MKPGSYRGATAIHVFNKRCGLLMDTAEGTYGQLLDHFGAKTLVDQALLKTRVVFITHIHGDHTLGICKILQERDQLLDKLPEEARTKLFVVTPQPMLEWMEDFHK